MMMSFFYSPAGALARNRRGREKEHHHRRASSASATGRRIREPNKPHETRSPTPRSPQATTSPPKTILNLASPAVPRDEGSSSQALSAAEEDAANAAPASKQVEELQAETDKTVQNDAGQHHSFHSFRTPSSLQPYLEDDISETSEEDSTAVVDTVVVTTKKDSFQEPHSTNTAARRKRSSTLGGSTVSKSKMPQGADDSSQDLPDASERRTREVTQRRFDFDQHSAHTANTNENTGQEDAEMSPEASAGYARHGRKSIDDPERRTEMKEKRRSILSQHLVSPDGSIYVEPSSVCSRSFTPPAGPLGAMSPNSPPPFHSPVPVRAPYPPQPYNTHLRGHPAAYTYPPGYHAAYPISLGAERPPGQIRPVSNYMDQMIGSGQAPALYQQQELASPMHSDDTRTLAANSWGPPGVPYGSLNGMLARIEGALPDIHQLLFQYREVLSQIAHQTATFRDADAQKIELLRNKDQIIDQLAKEVEHSQSHTLERKNLEMKTLQLEDECRKLKAAKSIAEIPDERSGSASDQGVRRALAAQVDDTNEATQDEQETPAQNVVPRKVKTSPPVKETSGHKRDHSPVSRVEGMNDLGDQFREPWSGNVKGLASSGAEQHRESAQQLLLQNLKLKEDLENVRSSWEADRKELLATKQRLKLAAAKLGIENVSTSSSKTWHAR